MPEQISSWGTAVQDSIAGALTPMAAAVPKLIAFLIILIIGWALAAAVSAAIVALLKRARFNDMAHRSGLAGVVSSSGFDIDAIGFVALAAKWFVRLIALVVAFDALGLPAVSETLRQLVLWLPNLIVALVVLVIGGLAANFLSGLVRASTVNAELQNPDLLAALSRGAVWAFAIVVAVNQLGIASELVTTLFTAVVAGLALALGLAFGLGGRDTAGEIIHDLYDRLRTGNVARIKPRPAQQEHLAPRREH